MSIEALCTGDKVIKQTATTTAGAMGGASRSYDNPAGPTLDCLIQNFSQAESRKYDARGQRQMYNVFFSSDVGLTNNNRLKQTVSGGVTLAVPVYYRVEAYYSEGRPGEQMLWIAQCSVESTRPEN